MQFDKWNSPLCDSRKEIAYTTGKELSKRLLNPKIIERAVARSKRLDEHFSWEADGNLGLLLLCSYLKLIEPNSGYDVTAHSLLSSAIKRFEKASRPNLALSTGLAGYGSAVQMLAEKGSRYQTLLARIDEVVSQGLRSKLPEIFSCEEGCCSNKYDAVSGIAGIGTYVLSRTDSSAEVSIDSVLNTIIWLSGELEGLPRYWTPRDFIHVGFGNHPLFKHGMINLGLSHGIPGLLSLLALAYLKGSRNDGISKAIESMARKVVECAYADEHGINWPAAVGISAKRSCIPSSGPSRTAWCYGTPGVAHSLWLAGEALNKNEFKAKAVMGMESSVRRAELLNHNSSPGFCHGLSGFLHLLLKFYNLTHSEVIANGAIEIFDKLISLYSSENLLGFQNTGLLNQKVDDPRLFEGASGIALVLFASSTDVIPAWDRVFMLS